MNLDKTGNDSISYVGTEGDISTYTVRIDGREVFTVVCGETDPDRIIYVRVERPDGHATMLPTAGRFTLTPGHMIEDADGNPVGMAPGHVNPISVYRYIVPRIAVMMSRLYCA